MPVVLVLNFLFYGLGFAAEDRVKAISPGGVQPGLVADCRPTFSWSAVSWADGYDLLVFSAPAVGEFAAEELLAQGEPLFEIHISGQGVCWVPDGETALAPGQEYVWFVRPFAGGGPGLWSAAARFVVDLTETEGFISDTLRYELSRYLDGSAGSASPFAGFSRLLLAAQPEATAFSRTALPAGAEEELVSKSTGLAEEAAGRPEINASADAGGDLPRGAAPDTRISLSGPVRVDVDNSGAVPSAETRAKDPILISFTHSFVDVGEVLYSKAGMRLVDEGYSSMASSYFGGNAYIFFEPDLSFLVENLGGTLRLFTTNKGEDAETIEDRGLSITEQGNVGIGTDAPSLPLHVVGQDNNGTVATVKIVAGSQVMLLDGNEIDAMTSAGGGSILYLNNNSKGEVRVPTLRVTGGSDFSEQFDISCAEMLAEPGMVVRIDPENAGRLAISDQVYDRRVAGIISGAGGVNPGMMMSQSATLADGSHPVALSGRVYCWVDADQGAVAPGDLLTTARTPGHAMKVSDYQQAQGAILGKAMTPLASGRGLVLVLVSLQ
ncbi:MAG: hypothetical protein JXR89_04440 [Deltaproteobacteria bacterium]|nr:hypothetical protein [Deltaproteobacteria bacterium]